MTKINEEKGEDISEVIVIGAGLGGLAAALRLARSGFSVQVLEARSDSGGLASSLTVDGFSFDTGPYLLLDKPGLEWAFTEVGLDLNTCLDLRRIEEIYSVSTPNEPTVRIHADLEETVGRMNKDWPGAGDRYRLLMAGAEACYQAMSPLQRVSNPRLTDLMRGNRWQWLSFLRSSLSSVLKDAGLPLTVQDAIGIWTHVAGESLTQAPSPLLFLPALMHSVGAFYPRGGTGAIAAALTERATAAGVRFSYGQKVTKITHGHGRVTGVTLAGGEFLPAMAIVANAAAMNVSLNLLDTASAGTRRRLENVRLQSPGVCAYLAVRRKAAASPSNAASPYAQFHLPGEGGLCRFLVQPGLVAPDLFQNGREPVRLLAPMRHEEAERVGRSGQQEYLNRLLDEPWWRKDFTDVKVLETCLPIDWGERFYLYKNSMNPVMTARWMGFDRFAHRSPSLKGLYLCGSATYPGYSISFCTISGVLAAGQLERDQP